MLITIITHFQNISFAYALSTLYPNIPSLVLMLVNDPTLNSIVVKWEWLNIVSYVD